MEETQIDIALQRIKEGREMLDALRLGSTGDRHLTILYALQAGDNLAKALREKMAATLDNDALDEGIVIREALRAAGLDGKIAQLTPARKAGGQIINSTPAKKATYRVEVCTGTGRITLYALEGEATLLKTTIEAIGKGREATQPTSPQK